MPKTIAQVHQDTLKLQSFIEGKNPGDAIGFKEIENQTGVKIDTRGRGLLYTALKRANLEYTSIRGYGIQLAAAATVLPILSTRIIKIDRAVRKADKSQKRLQEQFFHELTSDEQHAVLFIGAAFGAIRLAAENGKVFLKKRKEGDKLPSEIHISVPKF